MSKPKYRIEIEKENLISNSEILKDYIDNSLFKIIWLLNRQPISIGEVFDNIREIKRKYHGQGYIYYPIKFNEQGDLEFTDEDNKQGYIIISKRDFKLKFKYLLYTKNEELFEYINKDAEYFLNDVNLIIHGKSYVCRIYLNNKDNVLMDEIKNIYVDNNEELRNNLISRTKIANDEMFNLIKTIELPL